MQTNVVALRDNTSTSSSSNSCINNSNNNKSGLDKLIDKLNKIFEDDHINIDSVIAIMEEYQSCKDDWKQFAHFDEFKYTRNLVDTGNGKFNLLAMCWGEGQGSGIHDHSDSHCVMKVLTGEIKETLYEWPEKEGQALKEKRQTVLGKNSVTYISDKIGLHRVENPSHSDKAVSLHIYCPPFDFCNQYDQQVGKKTKCPVTFWSQYGVKSDLAKKIKEKISPDVD